jgi:hypothetical protein
MVWCLGFGDKDLGIDLIDVGDAVGVIILQRVLAFMGPCFGQEKDAP